MPNLERKPNSRAAIRGRSNVVGSAKWTLQKAPAEMRAPFVLFVELNRAARVEAEIVAAKTQNVHARPQTAHIVALTQSGIEARKFALALA